MKSAPAIYLEYGADEATCDDQEFELCEHGIRFKSSWQFEVGTEFRVAFTYSDSLGNRRRIAARGLLVECEPVCERCNRISLLFLDMGDDLRSAIRDVSGRLEAGVGGQDPMAQRLPASN